jgi:hypothetical protein
MNRWYLSLPKYAKEMTTTYKVNGKAVKVDLAKRKFVNSLKQLDTNPREFLFETVFKIFSMNEFTINVVPIIHTLKDEYDSAVNSLVRELIGLVKTLFSAGEAKGSLTSVIKDWYESLSEKARQYLYTGNESKILELMSTITNDEAMFIGRLAKAVTFLRIDDWNDDTVAAFLKDLKVFKDAVEDFNNQSDTDSTVAASYEIIFTDENGEKIPKRFDKAEYSDRAKLLLNEMNAHIDEYGQSITEQEKRQVLIELLEKLC